MTSVLELGFESSDSLREAGAAWPFLPSVTAHASNQREALVSVAPRVAVLESDCEIGLNLWLDVSSQTTIYVNAKLPRHSIECLPWCVLLEERSDEMEQKVVDDNRRETNQLKRHEASALLTFLNALSRSRSLFFPIR